MRILTLILLVAVPVMADVTQPRIDSLEVDGAMLYRRGQLLPARLKPGTWVTLNGSGFGDGPDVDFAKVLVGTSRALERDLPMFSGAVEMLKQLFYEKPSAFDQWSKDIRSWRDAQIVFRVPVAAVSGPISVHVQKRTGAVPSLKNSSQPFLVSDPITERVRGYDHVKDEVSSLGEAKVDEIPVDISNPEFEALASQGQKIYWAYDYNIGLVHHIRGLDWKAIFSGQTVDPVTGLKADPKKLFGAIPVRAGEVPDVARVPVRFDPYPIPMPVKPLLRKKLLSGMTAPSGYVGYVSAESIHPVTQLKGEWIGMNCAACHSQKITYEAAPGKTVTKVFAGIPNPAWSMKWNVLGEMKGVKGKEAGPDGRVQIVDKTQILYHVPPGTGEHTLVRESDADTLYANDYLFSPSAIPIITRHTPIRRALSHTELIAGFEGSYIHAQEPDGAIGAMRSQSLKQLTAYMTTLDRTDMTLERVGLYRWLRKNTLLNEIDAVSEGEFVERGKEAFPSLTARIEKGRVIFAKDCQSCHQPNFGTWTDENMFSFTEMGTYFSPTLFQKKNQSIRTAILRNLAWVEPRGLLHDGHVKSLEDLVHPDRCREGSALYQKYYTLNESTFHIPKGNANEERALRRHAYFVDVSWDKTSLYWDYQKMRTSFGPREFGTSHAVTLPATPHPFCATGDVEDLVHFLLTL